MKINRKDPKHWLYYAKSGAYILASIAMRPFFRRNKKPVITLYGHKLNGNLKAFAEYCQEKDEYDLGFATLDPDYYEQLKREKLNVNVLFLQKFRDVVKIARSDAIISDRKAHALVYYLYLTKIPFIDVWHGIQVFKKFFPERMTLLKRYREIWVSSKALAGIYSEDYGIDKNKIKVTGYARTDALVKGSFNTQKIREKYGIENKYQKIILLAPTWQQGDPKRQIIPFNEKPERFLSRLNETAKKHKALIVFRAHLNTNAQNKSNLRSMENIRIMSHNDYPQAEEFLAITDLFIGDWSSIAFDYLPLHRPAIFLDAPVPFKNGLTFEDEHRFGEIVKNTDELIASIEKYLLQPAKFMKEHSEKIRLTESIAYGDTLDGRASERYEKRLNEILRRA